MAISATNPQINTPKLTKFFYKITKTDASDAISKINSLTKGTVNPEYMNKVTEAITQRGYTYYGFIYGLRSEVITKKVIGKQGYFFKLTTENKKCDFIWHDRVSNIFMFWGEKANLINSMNAIRYRISKVYELEKQTKSSLVKNTNQCNLENQLNKMSIDK